MKSSGSNTLVLISRPAAIAAGLTRYFTGKPCKHGHISMRSVFNAGCITCWRPRAKNWKRNNRSRIAANIRQRRKSDPEHHKTLAKKSRDKRRKLKLVANMNRRARKAGAIGSYSNDDILKLLVHQNYLCAGPTCGKDISKDYTVDHKTPLVRGGSNWPRNLQLLCSPCNSSKWTKTQSEWLKSLRTQ